MNNDRDTDCFAVKTRTGEYFCGYNKWDTQIRKAKLYHWYSMVKEIRDDKRFIEKDTYIVRVTIFENGEANYE